MAQVFRLVILGLLASGQTIWRQLISQTVPHPYLDEVFHIPQALVYWSGKWTKWDPKITTPPGLYVISYALGRLQKFIQLDFVLGTQTLRFHNALLWFVLFGALWAWRKVDGRYRGRRDQSGSTVLKEEDKAIITLELVVIMFPLLLFFSGLYYTDLLSVLSVVVTIILWTLAQQQAGQTDSANRSVLQILFITSGLFSLAVRQTNVFWVAIYLGGLQAVETIKAEAGSKQVHDPPVADGFFEDIFITTISLVQSVITMIPNLLFDLWPQFVVLGLFGGFVFWNGGIVLGDKSNHVVTLHLPQMLYIWPFILFFSWPVLLPYLITPAGSLQPFILQQSPRLMTIGIFAILAFGAVHFNTVIHPFTLADNRHYVFYVFRHFILKYNGMAKYMMIPIYIVSGWLVVMAVGGVEKTQGPRADSGDALTSRKVRITWLLIWTIATAGSLVTAPLVEPRYFMLPWLIWRLHVPYPSIPQPVTNQKATEKAVNGNSGWLNEILKGLAGYSNWVELVWYLAINLCVGYMFLYREFTWVQEPGKPQRFMW